jgi:hypothetical protein
MPVPVLQPAAPVDAAVDEAASSFLRPDPRAKKQRSIQWVAVQARWQQLRLLLLLRRLLLFTITIAIMQPAIRMPTTLRRPPDHSNRCQDSRTTSPRANCNTTQRNVDVDAARPYFTFFVQQIMQDAKFLTFSSVCDRSRSGLSLRRVRSRLSSISVL